MSTIVSNHQSRIIRSCRAMEILDRLVNNNHHAVADIQLITFAHPVQSMPSRVARRADAEKSVSLYIGL
jgi:hypothetical protein